MTRAFSEWYSDRMGFDVIVIGLGGMGSAACWRAAKGGARVLGLEQFALAHDRGSSHGQYRLIRQAYFEEARYVPLLKRAYALWDELCEETGRKVFHRNGVLIMAPPSGGEALRAARVAGEQHEIPLEVLSSTELAREFPMFHPGADATGLYEPGGGYLEVENAVRAQAELATRNGAELHFEESVREWRADEGGVTVLTDRATYRARRLIITAGAWASRLLADLGLPLQVWRVPQFWFPTSNQPTGPRGMPCFAFDLPGAFIYGFPDRGEGLKIADHHLQREIVSNPAKVDRVIRPSDYAKVQDCIRASLPGVSSEPRAASVCLYTMSPDQHFILDRHPRHANVTYGTGFSGHGFKFTPVIGEILSELSERGDTLHQIDFLRWQSERPRTFNK